MDFLRVRNDPTSSSVIADAKYSEGACRMYRDFYHLEYVPFTDTSDSDLVNLSRRHQAVLERVATGIHKQQSLIVFLGEAGLGKVALLQSALEKYSDSKYKTILIDIGKIPFQHQIYFKDIVRAVYQELGYEVKYQASPNAMIDLHDILFEEQEKGSRFVIIIDNAHLLPLEVLKSIPTLIDAYSYEKPVAQLVLAGEPVLDQYLCDSSLKQLKKRVQLVAQLDTLNRQESIAYIQRKLFKALPAGSPEVFSNAAMHKIVKAANGIPRNLNMLCTDVLVAGCSQRKRPIPSRIVKQVLADFQMHRSRRTSRVAWLGVAMVLLAALVMGSTFRDSVSSYLQMAMQWPQQGLEQVRLLLVDRSPKNGLQPAQAPEQPVAPMSVDAPAAIPVDRPASEAVMPPPLTHTTPTSAPPEIRVEETPLQPRHDALQQVANLIDQHFPEGGAFDLQIWGNKAPDQAYIEDENLILYVMSDTAAFLRIDYYQADGKIVPLLPNPLINNQVRAGQRFTLGGNGNSVQFKVAPPFGVEMLTVVASQNPIDINAEVATHELNAGYIEHLSRQLQAYETQGKTAVAYVRIQTQRQGGSRPHATALQPASSHRQP
jgi:general secretion pathway protein A